MLPNAVDLDGSSEAAMVALRSLQNKLKPGSTGNIVLATAGHDTDIDKLAIFLGSWSIHSTGTKIIIYTDPNLMKNPIVRELYEEFEVESFPYTPPPPKDDPDDREEFSKPGRSVLHSLEQYQLFLDTKVQNARGVAIVLDVNEVVLQGDIFLDGAARYAVGHGQVLLTQEGGTEIEDILVSDSKSVYNASRDCYGSGTADKMAKKPIMSSAFAIGEMKAVREYVALMADIMGTRVRFKCLRSKRPDVSILSYLVHTLGSDPKYLDFKISLRSGAQSPVLSMAYGLPATIDARGVVHRMQSPHGPSKFIKTPSVVTAYSDHPLLLQYLLRRYASPVATLDFVQVPSGYVGESRLLKGLPSSWMVSAKKKLADMQTRGDTDVSLADIILMLSEAATARREELSTSGKLPKEDDHPSSSS